MIGKAASSARVRGRASVTDRAGLTQSSKGSDEDVKVVQHGASGQLHCFACLKQLVSWLAISWAAKVQCSLIGEGTFNNAKI